jgi:hypothetical protein
MSDDPDDAAGEDRERIGNPFDELGDDHPESVPEDFFEEVAVPELDDDAVWAAIMGEDADPNADVDPAVPAPASAPERPDEGGDSDAVVPKRQFCKKCEHFSEPPTVACTHPGTEIVELVGVDRFRVRDCPVVESRERAETVLPDRLD